MIIRPARPDERESLEDLRRRAGPALGEGAAWAEPPSIPLGEVIVAEVDGAVVGFAALEDGELDGLFVEPSHRRLGIGSALAEAAVHRARMDGLSLVTAAPSPAARAFLESCGFRAEGEAETGFGPAIRMSR